LNPEQHRYIYVPLFAAALAWYLFSEIRVFIAPLKKENGENIGGSKQQTIAAGIPAMSKFRAHLESFGKPRALSPLKQPFEKTPCAMARGSSRQHQNLTALVVWTFMGIQRFVPRQQLDV